MKRKLVTLACIIMSFASLAGQNKSWNINEQKDIKVIERDWGEDKRSIPYLPSLSHDNNIIYIYSDITFENLQVTILNEAGGIVYSNVISVFENQGYSFQFNAAGAGTYTIEMANREHSFWGQFTLY